MGHQVGFQFGQEMGFQVTVAETGDENKDQAGHREASNKNPNSELVVYLRLVPGTPLAVLAVSL